MMLDQITGMAKLDPEEMLRTAADLPALLQVAWRLCEQLPPIPKKRLTSYDHVVVVGMGGSAISGDLLANYLTAQGCSIPVSVIRDGQLPRFVGKRTLFFAMSYSGNTQETNTIMREAIARGMWGVAISSGGELLKQAQEHGWYTVQVPAGFQPRAALPFLFTPLLYVAAAFGYLPHLRPDFRESCKVLMRLAKQWGPMAKTVANPAKQLASRLKGCFPFVIGLEALMGPARRFQTQLNENSKVMALLDRFPELTHNQIVSCDVKNGFPKLPLAFILFTDTQHPLLRNQMAVFQQLFVREAALFYEVKGVGKSALARLLSQVYFADLVSVYLALIYRTDPTPVAKITELKHRLALHKQ